MNRIEKTKKYLYESYEKSKYLQKNPKEKMYRHEHTLRVAKWGEKIARNEELDQEALIVGCLLHDISYIEEMDTREKQVGHGRRSAEIVKDFVDSLGFEEETKKDILYGISIHVDGQAAFEWKDSVLAESISDADNLDRFDVYRIYETLEYSGYSSMRNEEKEIFCRERLDAIYQNLQEDFSTPFATVVFHDELRFMEEFYKRLQQQCLNSK